MVRGHLGLSPGAKKEKHGLCIVHTSNAPVFSSGKKNRGNGLEAQAEEGNATRLAKAIEGCQSVKSVVVFNTARGREVGCSDRSRRNRSIQREKRGCSTGPLHIDQRTPDRSAPEAVYIFGKTSAKTL